MSTPKPTPAPREGARKSRATSQTASSRGRRVKPGATGKGDYYHVEVRPKSQFTSFRTQDVGDPGGIERVAGKRGSGSWDTQKWLISKDYAHLENDKLIPDRQEAREVLDALGSEPKHVGGDRFTAKPRPNVRESEKRTPAQRSAQLRNIKKAQAARLSR